MSIKHGRNTEPYTGYIPDDLIAFYKPQTMFHTTRTGMECRRFHCATCGELHPTQRYSCQRVLEHINGTSLADALYRAREAEQIDRAIEEKHAQGQRVTGLNEYTSQSVSFSSSEQIIRPTGEPFCPPQ